MPDYGHPIKFGTFITPTNKQPDRPVELGVISEQLGFDLVTYQDHPYQATFLDTWTLMSWVAARTERIHISGNVLNLPLRQPAVLARSAASLDLLSGGRLELGIGAGGFYDAIASMGGPQLTAAEAVSGFDEALDVIRGIWDTSTRAPLTLDGVYHHTNGAARGPQPAHDIPIWIGALKPRMLRLIGRKGDGWLPSLPYLQPGQLAEGNRIIDEAATRAGRHPGEIVRMLNVGPQMSAEELAELAIDNGISVFVIFSDNPNEMQRFIETTAPEVRERVESARASMPPTGAMPPIRKGLPHDPLAESLTSRALEPGDRGYSRYTSSYFRGGRPALVIRPQTTAEVQDAVRYAARHRDLPLSVFSGGHGVSGRSLNTGGIVIAMDAMNEITVLDNNRVRVQAGAKWRDVAQKLAPHGRALTAGDAGTVAVGGLATAGGIGWFVREHGLTIDHMVSVDIVTANGELVHASADQHPELFWAMRGAGANFGVAVSFEFETDAIADQIGFAMLTFVPEDLTQFLQDWGTTIENAHPGVTGTLISGGGSLGQISLQAMIVVDSDDPDTIIARLQPFAQLAPMANQHAQLMPYAALLDTSQGDDEQYGTGEPHAHSAMVKHITPEVAERIADLLTSRGRFFFAIRSAGGAANDVDADATAFAWRDANFLIAPLGGGTAEYEARWQRLLPLTEGMYLSFETDTGDDVVRRAFPPAHLSRLRALKRELDPEGLFRDNFFIDPTVAD